MSLLFIALACFIELSCQLNWKGFCARKWPINPVLVAVVNLNLKNPREKQLYYYIYILGPSLEPIRATRGLTSLPSTNSQKKKRKSLVAETLSISGEQCVSPSAKCVMASSCWEFERNHYYYVLFI